MGHLFARRLVQVAALSAASLICAPAANATSYLATFNGSVNQNALPNDGDFPELLATGTAKFTVTYKDNQPHGPGYLPAIGFGHYLGTGSVWTIQMGSYTAIGTGGTFTATDGFLDADRFGGSIVPGVNGTITPLLSNGALTLSSVSFGLGTSLPSGNPTLFNTIDLPTSTFSGYTESSLALSFLFGTGGYEDPKFVSAFITDFSIVAVSEVPVPAALPLFASGLGVLGWAVRRRKQKQQAG